ncbi:MAG: hypothetical protein JXR70_06445 [Spirochaetales bacterium]|nr:hypothetical protein [Spirochaetales bacterium]
MIKAFTIVTFLCLIFYVFTACNMTMFPESLVYLQKRVDLKKYLPDNMDWVNFSLLGDACFINYKTDNSSDDQGLFVFDVNLNMINQKDPFIGRFDRFMMKEQGGSYLYGNLVFDKDLKGPTSFDRFSSAVLGLYPDLPIPPGGTVLVVGAGDMGSVRYIDIWSDHSTSFHAVVFGLNWTSYSKQDLNLNDYVHHDFKLYYDGKTNKAYCAFFVEDHDKSRVDLFCYNDTAYSLQSFELSAFFQLKTATFEYCDSSEFFFTQKGIAIIRNWDQGIVLYDYSGKQTGSAGFREDHGDMEFEISDDGSIIYVFNREYRILSKQKLWWK